MSRPVWLFSLDCEQFTFLPLVTAGLKSYYLAHGEGNADIEIVHFRYHADVRRWIHRHWEPTGLAIAREALAAGKRPMVAFSCYNWNMPTFLKMIAEFKRVCPELVVVAGGPQVQHYEPYIRGCGIDLLVMGEGEQTFVELLDRDEADWPQIKGLVFVDGQGDVVDTGARERISDLSTLPSPVEAVPTVDIDGNQIRWAAYETMRGCPYKCAFCQWGTGAIGSPVRRFPLERVERDLQLLVEKGVEGILFCDSNFGALPDDPDKARQLIALKQRYGRPIHFATCWSKNHNARVQSVVRDLHGAGLLEHYTMALQTLTPEALALSDRVNMRDYADVVKRTVADGIPIVSELIWGLPGETLANFCDNLDELTKYFPSHTIYPYAMLPGTELFDRQVELGIRTIEMAPYGEARSDYILASCSFDEEEGMAGYHLITAMIILYRGSIMPLTLRFLALNGELSMSALVQKAFAEMLEGFFHKFPAMRRKSAAALFENREFIYRWILGERDTAFALLRASMLDQAAAAGKTALERPLAALLALDHALCPRKESEVSSMDFDFDPVALREPLDRMNLPDAGDFAAHPSRRYMIDHSWDFGDSMVPRKFDDCAGAIRGRYPVWP